MKNQTIGNEMPSQRDVEKYIWHVMLRALNVDANQIDCLTENQLKNDGLVLC